MTPAARFFQALGDETRLGLLELLRHGDRTVGDLVDALGCPQPKVSRHLKVLREAGLVRPNRNGRHVSYALTGGDGWEPAARDWIDALERGLRLRPARVRSSPEPAPSPKTPPPKPPAAKAAPVPKPRRDLETHLL